MNLKPLSIAAMATLALTAFCQQSNRLPVQIETHIPKGRKNEIIRGQLLVKLRPGLALSRMKSSRFQMLSQVGPLGWTLWSIPKDVDPRQAVAEFAKDPAVACAEPVNRIYPLVNDPNDGDWGVQETDPTVVLDLGDVNPSFPRLWNLDETFARDAWDFYPGQYYTSGNKPLNAPIIAIIDSGCDQNHPDFMNAGGFSTNTTAGGQLNWSLSRHFSLGEPDMGSWNDDNGHGTHVAGLALASANNGTYDGHGIPGIGYNAQGMILKVIDQVGSGTDTDAAAAIFYAADNGADIISLSLGTENYSQIFQDAVTYAWQKGSLVVAAGNEDGNGGGDLGPIYPAACSGALGVSANGPFWSPATQTYSGTGSYVDISAPGGDLVTDTEYLLIQFVWSTAMSSAGGPGSLYDLSQQGALYPPYTINYAYLAGTSMACPQVSGAAALYYGYNNLRQAQGHVNKRAYRAIERSALSALGAPNGGWEPTQGYGVLDAVDLLFDTESRGATIGSIEGIVYFGATPVSNVAVRAQKTTGGTIFSTTTRADGGYRFDGLPPATYIVTVTPFGSPKQKKALVTIGSDATGCDFWVNGNIFETTPPTVPIFTVDSANASSVTFSQWGYDVDTGIDSIVIRIGTSSGASNVYPDTELITENKQNTIGGLTLTSGTTYYLRAVYTNGIGMTTTVDRTFSFGTQPTVTGTLTLQDYTGSPVAVTVEIRNPGSTSPLQTLNVTPAANGTFSFAAPTPGTYDIAFKGSHWLRLVIPNVVVTGSGASGLTPSLVNGDVNGDNTVSITDFIQLRNAFGSSPGAGNWNANADLNGNLTVSISDFNILRSRFGQSGTP